MAKVNGQTIKDEYGTGIVLASNFTVNTNTPLDVRLTKTTKDQLFEEDSWVRNSKGQFLVYTGMLVVVTNDDDVSNNGIWEYIGPDDVKSADPKREEYWVHLISGETSNTTINGNSGAFTLGNGLQLNGTEISAKGTGYLTVGTDGINIDSTKIIDYGAAEGHDKLITQGYLNNRIDEFVGGVTGGVRYLATVSPTEFDANYRLQEAKNGNMVKFNTTGKIKYELNNDDNTQLVKEGDVVIYNDNNKKWDYIPSGDDIEYTGVNVGDTVVISPTSGGNVKFDADGTLLTVGVGADGKTITYSASEALSLAVGKANSALQSVIGDTETNDGLLLDGFNTEFVNVRTTDGDSDDEIKVQSGLKIGSVKYGIEQGIHWEFIGIYTGEEGSNVDINEGDIVDVYNVFEDMKKLNPVYGDNTILDGDGNEDGDNFHIPAGTKTVDYEKDSTVLIGELPTGIKLSCLTSSDGNIASIINEIKDRVQQGGLRGQISEAGVAVYRKTEKVMPAENGLATAADVKTYVDTHKSVVYGVGSVQVSSAYIGSETMYSTDLVWLNSID